MYTLVLDKEHAGKDRLYLEFLHKYNQNFSNQL